MAHFYCVNRVKRENVPGQRTAGKKAPDDIAKIICSIYGEDSLLAFKEPNSLFPRRISSVVTNITNWKVLEETVAPNDVVLLQHPYEGVHEASVRVPKLRKRGVHFISLIHDLLSLRRNIEAQTSNLINSMNAKDELRLLKCCDSVIAHNEAMSAFLTDCGVKATSIVTLQLFDYLANEVNSTRYADFNQEIVIAGNLSPKKAGYIYELDKTFGESLRFNLYGPNLDKSTLAKLSVKYLGQYDPFVLPNKLSGNYGLVWDGPSIITCTGFAGEYCRYNNPHKASLYIAAGLPLIVWNESAIADYVNNNGIGLSVRSLSELKRKLSRIGKIEYMAMKNNVLRERDKVINGYYTINAISRALSIALVTDTFTSDDH